MITLYKTQVENENNSTSLEVTVEPINDTSLPVEIDSPYLTLPADRVVTMNKMQLAIHVMRNIQSDDVDQRDQTGIFKGIMMNLGVTKSGCYTYARNVRQHLSGGDAYSSNKKWNKKRADELKAQRDQTVTVADLPEQPIEKPAEELNRWCVEDKDTNSVLTSFTSRAAAQTYNKKLKESGKNTRWFDNEKKSA